MDVQFWDAVKDYYATQDNVFQAEEIMDTKLTLTSMNMELNGSTNIRSRQAIVIYLFALVALIIFLTGGFAIFNMF